MMTMGRSPENVSSDSSFQNCDGPLSIETSSIGSGEEEVEISIPKAPSRKLSKRLRSSRLFSLLDHELQTAGLDVITDDDSCSRTTRSLNSINIVAVQDFTGPTESAYETPILNSPLSFFSDEVNSYLQCTGGSTAPVVEDRDQNTRKIMPSLSEHDCSTIYFTDEAIGGKTSLCANPCGVTQMCSLGEVSSSNIVEAFPSSRFTGCTGISLFNLRQDVATDIADILGSTSTATEGWISSWWLQAEFSPREKKPQRQNPAKNIPRKIRNRCGQRKTQISRLKQIWSKWHGHNAPSGIHPKRTMVTTPHLCVEKAKSLDDVSISLHPDEDTFDLGYDSDPGALIHTFTKNSLLRKGGVHHSSSPMFDEVTIDTSLTVDSFPSIHGVSRSMVSFDSSLEYSNESEECFEESEECSEESEEDGEVTFDDDAIRDSVKEFMMQKMVFRYHPPPEKQFKSKIVGSRRFDCSSESGTPVTVKVWCEMGTRLKSKVIQPKLMWQESYEPELHQNRRLALACQSIDLLTIVRILKPTYLDRDEYPFAIPDHSFLVHSLDGDVFLFETENTIERDLFVGGLKLAVARLASMIIVSDDAMFYEFFSPWAHTLGMINGEKTKGRQLTLADTEEETVEDDENSQNDTAIPSFLFSTTRKDQETLWGGSPKFQDNASVPQMKNITGGKV